VSLLSLVLGAMLARLSSGRSAARETVECTTGTSRASSVSDSCRDVVLCVDYSASKLIDYHN
jgi:hypothetical protein